MRSPFLLDDNALHANLGGDGVGHARVLRLHLTDRYQAISTRGDGVFEIGDYWLQVASSTLGFALGYFGTTVAVSSLK